MQITRIKMDAEKITLKKLYRSFNNKPTIYVYKDALLEGSLLFTIHGDLDVSEYINESFLNSAVLEMQLDTKDSLLVLIEA